jgi:hypothetical protein
LEFTSTVRRRLHGVSSHSQAPTERRQLATQAELDAIALAVHTVMNIPDLRAQDVSVTQLSPTVLEVTISLESGSSRNVEMDAIKTATSDAGFVAALEADTAFTGLSVASVGAPLFEVVLIEAPSPPPPSSPPSPPPPTSPVDMFTTASASLQQTTETELTSSGVIFGYTFATILVVLAIPSFLLWRYLRRMRGGVAINPRKLQITLDAPEGDLEAVRDADAQGNTASEGVRSRPTFSASPDRKQHPALASDGVS